MRSSSLRPGMGALLSFEPVILGAGGVLMLTLLVGTIVHEWTHAAVLRLFDVPYEVEWWPYVTGRAITRPIATVTPIEGPHASAVGLRIAAMAPLVLTVPFLAVFLGFAPDPLAVGDPYVTAGVIGWAGCALPSPQDFGVFWHAGPFNGDPTTE